MLTIDGSKLEGGGQIVRSAVALSAITGEPVQIVNIRAGRPVKGLAAQHLAAVRAVAACCEAVCEGLEVRSERLVFEPGGLKPVRFEIDVGTAGSIPLVLQAWLPVAIVEGGSIRVRGGTEVEHAPTIDYIERVLLRVLKEHGLRAEMKILSRGYYPGGGGEVLLEVEPSRLSPLVLDASTVEVATIVSCSQNLPAHVAERQARAAGEVLRSAMLSIETILDRRNGRSTGTSCTIAMSAKGCSALGKPGLPAERVGATAAEGFLAELRSPGSVDAHLSDQLLLYLARFGGRYTCATLTMHARTVCWLLSRFGLEVEVKEDGIAEFSARRRA